MLPALARSRGGGYHRQQCRTAFKLADIVIGAMCTLLAIPGVIQLRGTAIRAAGGAKSMIVQRSYEGFYLKMHTIPIRPRANECLPTRSSQTDSVTLQMMHLQISIGRGNELSACGERRASQSNAAKATPVAASDEPFSGIEVFV